MMLLGIAACGGANDVVIGGDDAGLAPAEAAESQLFTGAEVDDATAVADEPASETPTLPTAGDIDAESVDTFLPPGAEAIANGLGDVTFDLPACPDSERGAVTDKANQRYWLCMDGEAVTDEIPMTTASSNYGLPPVGTYEVFARDEDAYGIGGEALERFVAFYTTPKGNRIAFHEVVDQDPDTVGDLDQRGASAGCFRVREADSIQVWEFLRIGDPVVVLTN